MMITTAPIRIPNIFDTIITPFEEFSCSKELANDKKEVKANFYGLSTLTGNCPATPPCRRGWGKMIHDIDRTKALR